LLGAKHIEGDVTNYKICLEIIESIKAEYGRLDVLVCNVGSGADLDTRTRISSPNIGQNNAYTYIGYCRSDVYPDTVTPILTWSGDNTGQGFESVFINLIELKNQYPSYSASTITIDMNARWWGTTGSTPVIMDIIMYKGGTVSLMSDEYLFINEGYTDIFGVASTGTNITLQSNTCLEQEHVVSLQYNLSTYNGQFI
jgi:NAD(P)-dependent dehydrogenase (short-subunit alcohol dehydrogenase family)